MPQDGSNNYQYPPGTRGVPDQTIESEAYNTFLDDLVVNDLNIARPIHRGGTGATTANAAIFNLGGERAAAVVTNYDSHLWMPGSFYSAAGATGAPVPGRAFVGIAYSSDPPAEPPANLNVIIEARDQNDTTVPGRVHTREKKAGVWGVWKSEDRLGIQTTPPSTVNSPDGALWWDNDNGVLYINYNDGNTTQWVQAVALPQIDTATFVVKAGDTMTGRLTLSDDPLNDLHAVPKRYVDGGINGVSTRRNRIINGAMQISQEWDNLLAGPTSVANHFVADQWQMSISNAVGFVTTQRVQVTTSRGSRDRIRITVTTASSSSMGIGEYLQFVHHIEGNVVADFLWGTPSAKQVILRFGFKGPAGTYSAVIRNGDANNRSYIVNFTISAGQANTDTEQTFVILGDQLGVWETGNLRGLQVRIVLAAGPNYVGVAGWNDGALAITVSNTNGFVTVGNAFELFDVGLYLDADNVGAPPKWEMPDVGQELTACMRYYEMSMISGTRFYAAGAAHVFTVPLEWKVVKRVAPTASISGTGTRANVSGVSIPASRVSGGAWQIVSTATGDCYALNEVVVATARL